LAHNPKSRSQCLTLFGPDDIKPMGKREFCWIQEAFVIFDLKFLDTPARNWAPIASAIFW
jgi:hypothetical protein